MNGLATTLKSFVSSPSPGEKRTSSLVSLSHLFSFGSGTKINASTALTIPAYYRGVNQIANDIAKLPKGIFQKKDGSRIPLDSPLRFMIDREVSPNMNAFTFHFVMMQAAINRGNGVAIIINNSNTGKPESLFFVHPDDLRDIVMHENKIYYLTKYGTFTRDEVVHIMGFTENGYKGISLIKYAAQILGIAKASQQFSESNFENKGLGYGVVESEKEMGKTAKEAVENAVNAKLSAKNEIRTVMLDEGMKYKPITLNSKDAQLVEQANFTVLDIARFLNISPRKLGDLSKDSYSSAYQEAIAHVQDCIMPHVKKWEMEYDSKLFSPQEKQSGHYVKFNLNSLLQGDLQAKADYYSKMLYAGVFSRNEVRAFEEMNSVEGLDEHLTPVNTKLPEEIEKGLEDGK